MRDLAREELLEALRALRPEFERMGVTAMSLFGSRARQDNRPDSDVDLVIDIDPHRKFSYLDAIGVGHVVEDHLGFETSVVVLDRFADPKFVATLERDRVAVF
jgi:predicted nucleotidyltransferase